MSYATSGSCRHSVMVNHFDPGTFTPVPSTGKCGGGCDNCATTTHPAVDVTRPALLMASVLDYMGGYFGLGKVMHACFGLIDLFLKEKYYFLSFNQPLFYSFQCPSSKSINFFLFMQSINLFSILFNAPLQKVSISFFLCNQSTSFLFFSMPLFRKYQFLSFYATNQPAPLTFQQFPSTIKKYIGAIGTARIQIKGGA